MTSVIRILLGPLVLLIFSGSIPAQEILIHGVKVGFTVTRCTFPKRWTRKEVDALATPLPDTSVRHAAEVLKCALSKYPEELTARYLKNIYVFKSMEFNGYPYGGTYSVKKIYLTFDEANPMNNGGFLEERLHHEFSSILWRENPGRLDTVAWKTFNAAGFVYGEGGADAIRSGIASMETEPGYFGIGFINRYSMADIEQDINVIAQKLFCGDPAFWKTVDANPGI
jgi:hypothetical protein